MRNSIATSKNISNSNRWWLIIKFWMLGHFEILSTYPCLFFANIRPIIINIFFPLFKSALEKFLLAWWSTNIMFPKWRWFFLYRFIYPVVRIAITTWGSALAHIHTHSLLNGFHVFKVILTIYYVGMLRLLRVRIQDLLQFVVGAAFALTKCNTLVLLCWIYVHLSNYSALHLNYSLLYNYQFFISK